MFRNRSGLFAWLLWLLPLMGSASEPPTRQRHFPMRREGSTLAPRTASAPLGSSARTSAPPRQAVLDAIREVTGSLNGIEETFTKQVSRLQAQEAWLANAEVVTRHVEPSATQVKWLRGTLESATTLAGVATEAEDSDMELGVLRMTGPKLQAAMFGTMLLATWVDFLQLADASLRHCPMCNAEQLSIDLHQVQDLMEPTWKDLQSLDPKRLEQATAAMPELMGTLTLAFARLREDTHAVMKLGEKVSPAAQLLERMTLLSPMERSLPPMPPSTRTTVLRASDVTPGSRTVLSAEWVERMRQLVQAGVLSLPAVSAAVRIHIGQGMDTAGANRPEAPKHHVLPREHREWFEQRGFKGDTDIDQFCVQLEQPRPEATPGSRDWKLGHTWPGEWNRLVMQALREAELTAGRRLTRGEVLHLVAGRMKEHKVPRTFVTGSTH
ncbi:hypothetical protein MYSTI_06757 [Myxococcus stipitatus DSM 14675]|uniref:DUF2380 domain-containing protein n=1 Tax=Myxococcus stipitatus (strain DSM 14675 / JCM 12634 / Mx s8) TaxID=1278073 RepID=L7UJG0_MYXSD|nr:hypothetical protein [Myxococcus stipitatus]AGC48030.1 hypothetical protein MYSTI_06757 [Myxococcus stipitatus DSM 14675]